MPVGLKGSGSTDESCRMAAQNGQRQHMRLYSNMNDYEHLPSNCCVARSCCLRVQRLQVYHALEQDLKAMVICVAMQGSRRSLRSDQLPVQPSGTIDVDLDLVFTLQYPHFLKRRENHLQIMLQRRKKYKTRTILGYKTLAIGHVNMGQVLQGWYSNQLHLYTKDSKEPAASLSISSLSSEPIDREIQDRRHTIASITEPLLSSDEEGEDESTDTDVDDMEIDTANRIPSRKIKKKFLKRLFNKLRVADADLVGDVQKELQKELQHDINDIEDEEFSYDDDDDDSDNDVLDDNLSIASLQKPGLRPYFDQSQSQTALNQSTLTKEEAKVLRQAFASEIETNEKESDTLRHDVSANSSDNPSKRVEDLPNIFTKNNLRSLSFREKRAEKQQLKRKSSVDIPKLAKEQPSANFTNQLSRVLDNDDKIPEYIMMVDMKDDLKQEKNLNLKLISIFDSIVCTSGAVEVQAIITAVINKFQKFSNRHSVSPPPLCLVVFGTECYLRKIVKSYVEQFAQKPQYQSFVKFLIIPFGPHKLASYIAHVDRTYCNLFADNFWNTIVEQCIISDTDLKEVERRVRYYIDNSDIVQSLPIAEALVTRKLANGESSQCFIPFITEVRIGSAGIECPYDAIDGENFFTSNGHKEANSIQYEKPSKDQQFTSARYEIVDGKSNTTQNMYNETQDLVVDYWPLPSSMIGGSKKEEKKEGNKLSIKSSFKSLVVSRMPSEENEDTNGLLFSANIKNRNKGVKRLMNKKDKDGESKNNLSVVVSKVVCTARSSGHTFSVNIDGKEWTNVKFFSLSSQWPTHIKQFPVAIFLNYDST